jgi:hypothetical protein
MPSKAETDRRKALRRAAEQCSRSSDEARIPISRADLAQLFAHLDIVLSKGCAHTLAHTREFLNTHKLPESAILPWLAEYGGYCDCEVLANVEERWGQG